MVCQFLHDQYQHRVYSTLLSETTTVTLVVWFCAIITGNEVSRQFSLQCGEGNINNKKDKSLTHLLSRNEEDMLPFILKSLNILEGTPLIVQKFLKITYIIYNLLNIS
jgi:hypothetical protein